MQGHNTIGSAHHGDGAWQELGIRLGRDRARGDREIGQAQAEHAEAQLRKIMDALPSLAWCCLPDGAMECASKRWHEYTGLSSENVRGSGWTFGIHDEDLPGLIGKWPGALAAGEASESEARLRRFDGEYRWFLLRMEPGYDDAGKISRWFGINTDIEDLKRTQERLRQAERALRHFDGHCKSSEEQAAFVRSFGGETEAGIVREDSKRTSMFEGIIGYSEPVQRVLTQIRKVAPTDSTVLILGETGTGKELTARAIHQASARSAKAFIRVNCAAIPEALIASELFGHEKGAFTGALQKRLGRFELAQEGTIFLDEVGDLPAEIQVALLRVLQEREFERLGGTQTISVNVRIIAATNRDLRLGVSQGNFREDLFYRLNVIPMQLPPLRERYGDIRLLVDTFVTQVAKKTGKEIRRISNRTLQLFDSYHWPGNIRELQNLVERAVILSEGQTLCVDESWLAPSVPISALGNRLSTLPPAQQERADIETVLQETKGRISGPLGAAVKLGMPRQTLESKIKRLGINWHRFKTVGAPKG
jgi:formate hydrogenlyase transcriptional activator